MFQARIASSSGASEQTSSNSVLVAIQLEAARLLNGPHRSQVGSVASAPNSGSNNRGPTAAAMVIRSYGNSIDLAGAAIAILDSNTASNGPTDFKGSTTKSVFSKSSSTGKAVTTFDGMRAKISQGRPVIVLLKNSYSRYLDPRPYENNTDDWFKGYHSVVVTGYTSPYVSINDPLRRGTIAANCAIPITTFKPAASDTHQLNSQCW